MARVKIGPTSPDRMAIDVEVARLRDLDAVSLRARWRTAFRHPPPEHLSRHLLFRVLAYRLQADQFGDLDNDCRRLLDEAATPETAGKNAAGRQVAELKQGTILGREWNGTMHRVTVMADGFAWNGTTYPSLSKIALAITGTRWNGPRFFGLRQKLTDDKSAKESRS